MARYLHASSIFHYSSKAALVVCFLLSSIALSAQFGRIVPWQVVAGDPMVGGFHVTMDLGSSPFAHGQRYADDCIVASGRHIYVQGVLGNENYYDVFRLPDTSDYTLTDVMHKTKRDSSEFLNVFATLSNGSILSVVIRYPVDSSGLFPYMILKKIYKPSDTTAYAHIKKVIGDDLYQWVNDGANDFIYVSHDTGATWSLDTAGLQSARVYDIAYDTAQNAWLATANGLYTQTLAGSTWLLTTCPIASPSLVYVDSRNRLWVYGSSQLYYSTDYGATWHMNTSGLPGYPILKLGDDPYGNIYAILNSTYSLSYGDKVYESPNGTGAFMRVDQNLSSLNAQTGDSAIYTVAMGDSTHIYIGGLIGMHGSPDGGTTWAPVDIASEHIYGLVRANNNAMLTTNAIGCFKSPSGNISWTKTYPQNGYSGGRPIYRDDAGDIYTQGINLGGLYSGVGPYMTVKSSDNGSTWTPDTAGISITSQYVWWVDESGNQYAGSLYTNPLILYSKPNAGSWALDTVGITAHSGPSDYVGAFGSDHNGRIYVSSGSGNVFSRPIGGGAWALESGLNGDIIYSMAHTSNHTMVAGGNSDAHYKNGSSWQTFPINAPAPYGVNKFAIAVDDSDYVWVAFSHQGTGGNYTGDGVYYTHDYGNTWYSPTGNLNVVTFRQLVSIGDTMYGISYSNGVFIFLRNDNPNGISEIRPPLDFVLYPNPASAEFTLLYSLANDEKDACVGIYDLNGALIRKTKISNESVQATFSTSGIQSGLYICTLESEGKIISRQKLEILR